MDIAGLAMGMSQTQVMDAVSTQVLSMSLDMMEQLGSGMVEMLDQSMMEQSVSPNLGGNLDLYV